MNTFDLVNNLATADLQRLARCNCKVVDPIKDGHQCELAGRGIDLRCSVEAM